MSDGVLIIAQWVASLPIVLILAGAALLRPEIAFKALALALFLVIASPVASPAIAATAHRQGVPRVGAVCDDLGAAPAGQVD